MRFLRLIIPFLILFTSDRPAQAQDYWRPLEKTTTKNLNRLCFLDSLSGWVVGDSGTIIRTTNGGQSWVHQESGVTDDIIDIFMLNANRGWALALDLVGPTYGTTILTTTNSGANWQSKPFPVEERFFYKVRFLDSLVGWMGGGSFVGTTNGGVSWFDATVDSSLWANHPVRNIKFFSPNYGYAIGGIHDISAVIWRTTNGGGNWSPTEVGAEPLNDFHYFDSLNIMCIGGDFEYGVSLVKSSDAGESWEYVYLGIMGEGRALSFRTSAEAWSAMGYSGTYMYTLDSGRTWSDIYTPDSSGVYDVVFTDERNGYMVGKRGTVLKYNPSVLNADERNFGGLPTSNTLYQNYPNPFNPVTIIGYDLPETSYATVTIYDVIGREMQSIDLGIQRAGAHQFPFAGNGLASGVYFYRLSARSLVTTGNSYVQTKKMMLLR